MAYDDLRVWIAALEWAGELKTIRTEVDPILEIAEITDRVSKSQDTRVTAEKNLTEKQKSVLSAVEARAAAEKALTELSAVLEKANQVKDAAEMVAKRDFSEQLLEKAG